MSTSADLRVTPAREPVAGVTGRPVWRRLFFAFCIGLFAVGLFIAYRRMAWAWPINADGASNALQAWDLGHGNLLLHGWTLSDVSFYGTELVQYTLMEMLVGVRPETVHSAAAVTYTVLVLLTAVLAKGRATGWAGALRVGIALAVMLVPSAGPGYQILLGSPDHTGSAVPMVLAWIVLDRARTPRWWVPVLVGGLLAWGQAGDPLVTFVGAVPLVLVSAVHVVRQRSRGYYAQLVAAGVGSILVGHLAIKVVHWGGGFRAPAPPVQLSPLAAIPHRAEMTVRMVGVLFGVYRPGTALTPFVVTLGVVHALGLVLVAVALVVVAARLVGRRSSLVGRRSSDLVDQILVVAMLVNIGAELVSTLSVDILAGREIAPVVPLGAALAARVCAGRISRWRRTPVVSAGLAVLAVLVVALFAATPARAAPSENQQLADWLDRNGLTYGLASYWNAANVTVTTERRVTVVPVAGEHRLAPFCWQSQKSWYDQTRHDARFVVYDPGRTMLGSLDTIKATFGAPVETHTVDGQQVLMYDHNLLADLAPAC
jgi:hypothetical protein